MAVIKVNGSLTHGQVADIDRFSAASGIPVDTSQAVIVDTPVKDTEEVYKEIIGGEVEFKERPYHIFMCATDKDGNNLTADGTVADASHPADFKNLEYDFNGLKYMSMKGLDAIGNPKIYVEEYADSDTLRTYIPKEVKNSPIECELTLAFVGKDRYKVYHAFNEYVRQGYHRYFDNKRLKELIFFVSESIEPSEEIWKGSVPYIQVTYKLRSIKGHAVKK